MGAYAGPDVSENGLVLALDAGNNKSHSTNRFISYGSGLVTENVTFSIQGTGTFQRVAAGTVIGGYNVKATDVVYSYALGATGCHYHGNTVPVPAGVRGTFSFDYFVTGATTYPINNYLANFEGTLTGAITAPNSLQNVWQRRSFTSGVSASSGTFNAYLYPGACGGGRLADSGTIYYRNPRVEFTNVDTGTDNFSSMPNLTTWYDMVGSNNGTLTNTPYHFIGGDGTNGYMSFDGTNDEVQLPGTNLSLNQMTISSWNFSSNYVQNGFMFEKTTNGNVNTQYSLFYNNGNQIYYRTYGLSTTDLVLSSATTYVINNKWNYIVATFDGTNKRIYVNGILRATSANLTGTVTQNSTGIALIGRHGNPSSYPFNGRIAQTQIYNRALTASEIQQNYNATKSRFGL